MSIVYLFTFIFVFTIRVDAFHSTSVVISTLLWRHLSPARSLPGESACWWAFSLLHYYFGLINGPGSPSTHRREGRRKRKKCTKRRMDNEVKDPAALGKKPEKKQKPQVATEFHLWLTLCAFLCGVWE